MALHRRSAANLARLALVPGGNGTPDQGDGRKPKGNPSRPIILRRALRDDEIRHFIRRGLQPGIPPRWRASQKPLDHHLRFPRRDDCCPTRRWTKSPRRERSILTRATGTVPRVHVRHAKPGPATWNGRRWLGSRGDFRKKTLRSPRRNSRNRRQNRRQGPRSYRRCTPIRTRRLRLHGRIRRRTSPHRRLVRSQTRTHHRHRRPARLRQIHPCPPHPQILRPHRGAHPNRRSRHLRSYPGLSPSHRRRR